MSRTEDLIKAAQTESEATRDEPYPADAPGQRPHRARSVVQSVRLPADAFAEVEAIAKEHDIPVGALIRGWVLRAVAAERDLTLADAVDRLAADVDRLRRLAHDSAA
jgi:predicted DNA-binding ribbon-helix-helix protein